MSFCCKRLPFFLSIVALLPQASALDKDKKFAPGPASSYAAKQTNGGLTIAAVPYDTAELTKAAFGKMDPYQHGVLPVLVILQNDSSQAIKLENIQVEYMTRDRSKIEPTAPSEVKYLDGPRRPNMNPRPLPGLSRRRKNPLGGEEIELRSFAAKMLPPGESAHGFFYFQTGHGGGSKLFVMGLEEARSGKEMLYFEIPFN